MLWHACRLTGPGILLTRARIIASIILNSHGTKTLLILDVVKTIGSAYLIFAIITRVQIGYE